ncbi:hypothetical protein [Streptomyces sp. D2-8]|uniref:hypothetical protein n=1 Tax=Streptomyces sp. D2-8 TaxID=2707767 RepID=UPI0020BD5EC7|nr:hypothetical protein [Streptomyces sp. D2-8]
MGELSKANSGRAAALVAVCLAVALSSGCTADDSPRANSAGATARQSTPSAQSGAPTDRAEHIDGETVTKAPQVVDGEVITSVADARGNRAVPLDGGVRSGPVSIAVNCQGKGTLKVELKPVGLNFPLECVAGEVSSTYNQIALKKGRKDAVLQVTAGSGVRWALSVGQ